MILPRVSLNFEKYWTAINMAFLDQSVDKYLREKMNSFLVSNFRSSLLFDSIHFVNDQIDETKMNTTVT